MLYQMSYFRLYLLSRSRLLRDSWKSYLRLFFSGHNCQLQTTCCLLIKWGEKDSNLRSRKTTDLQSVAFGHSGISPIHLNAIRTGAVFTTFSEEPMEGFEPPTH